MRALDLEPALGSFLDLTVSYIGIEKHQHALATVASRRRVLRLPEVEAVTGLKHSAIYEAIAAGTFPAPIALTASARGWIETEIDAWLDQRIAKRDAQS